MVISKKISDHISVLSDQIGDLVRHMSFQERKLFAALTITTQSFTQRSTYRSNFSVSLGELPCQTKVQHKTGMQCVWSVTHGKIGLQIK